MQKVTDGLCYYHYLFKGKRRLERSFIETLSSGKLGFPFCLCWVNKDWTRRWHGLNQEVLIVQHYSPADDLARIQALLRLFLRPALHTHP